MSKDTQANIQIAEALSGALEAKRSDVAYTTGVALTTSSPVVDVLLSSGRVVKATYIGLPFESGEEVALAMNEGKYVICSSPQGSDKRAADTGSIAPSGIGGGSSPTPPPPPPPPPPPEMPAGYAFVATITDFNGTYSFTATVPVYGSIAGSFVCVNGSADSRFVGMQAIVICTGGSSYAAGLLAWL